MATSRSGWSATLPSARNGNRLTQGRVVGVEVNGVMSGIPRQRPDAVAKMVHAPASVAACVGFDRSAVPNVAPTACSDRARVWYNFASNTCNS